jgi:hypothetical protein
MAEDMFSFPSPMRGTWAEDGKATDSRTSKATKWMGLDFTEMLNNPISNQYFGLGQ